jgi:hypothetical protein
VAQNTRWATHRGQWTPITLNSDAAIARLAGPPPGMIGVSGTEHALNHTSLPVNTDHLDRDARVLPGEIKAAQTTAARDDRHERHRTRAGPHIAASQRRSPPTAMPE